MTGLETDTITIEKIVHAPVEEVWKAWTEPDLILDWFGSDPGGKGVKAKLDVRMGGSFEISFKDSDDTEHTCSGIYTEVKELSKLNFTWTWKAEPGVESYVIIELAPANNFTRMVFQHGRLGTGSKHNYLTGWQNTFEKLERMLTAR